MDTELMRQETKERLFQRNAAVWHSLDTLGYAVNRQAWENILLALGHHTVRQGMEIIDENVRLDSELRQKLFEMELAGLETEQRIALANFETDKQVLMLKIAGQNYLLAAQEYDIKVQDQIMAAREFAAAQEIAKLALEKARAQMAVEREEAKVKEIEARLLLEKYEQAKVEVDVARSKLQVAKNQVQAILANIEVEETKLKIVEANVDVAMAEAEKASLRADVASILADIITRQLAEIRYHVEEAEIEAGFGYIKTYLDDMLKVWASRVAVEQTRKETEEAMIPEVEKAIAAQMDMAEADLDNMTAKEFIWNVEKAIMSAQKEEEKKWRTDVQNARLDLMRLKSEGQAKIEDKGLWGKFLVNAARRWAAKNAILLSSGDVHFSQKIYKGFLSGDPSFPSVFSAGEGPCGG